MPYIDPCDSVIAQLTKVARENIARSILGEVSYVMEGFALGRYGYQDLNPVKVLPIVDPTGIAEANITLTTNSFSVGDRLIVNGNVFTFNIDWSAGADVNETAYNIATAINNVLNINVYNVRALNSSDSIYLYSIPAGSIGNTFTLSKIESIVGTFNISGPLFQNGKNGCLGGSDGGLVDKIFPNSNLVSPLDSTSIRKFNITSGNHNGPQGITLYDSTKSWTVNQFAGAMISNITDGSRGLITSNTNKAIYTTLSGGVCNYWKDNDTYLVGIEQPTPQSVSVLCRLDREEGNWGYGEIATYAKIIKSNYPAEVGQYFMFAIGHMPIIAKNNKQVSIFRVITQY